MDNKIFLDSGVVITLGKLHAFCTNKLKNSVDYSNVQSIINTYRKFLHEALQKDVNILDFDINSILDLYVGIMNKEIVACVPPFVFKEIAIDTSRGALTKEFFKHCYLVFPKDELSTMAMPIKTLSLDKELVEVKAQDSANPEIYYGLNPDAHTKTERNEVDVNNEDRWILSQVNYLAELGDENLRFISGSEIFYPSSAESMTHDGLSCKSIVEYLYDETMNAQGENYEKEEKLLRDFLEVNEPISQKTAKQKVLFLHQNEKDYGRVYNGVKRNRTYTVNNENSLRDARAMHGVTKMLEEIATNTEVVTYDNRALLSFLERTRASSYERQL